MKNNFRKTSRRRKKNLAARLEHDNEVRAQPMMNLSNLRFELSEKFSATAYGGIGFANELLNALNVPAFINDNLSLFKMHKPYFESDHILNMSYNILTGGNCLEDIERLRNDGAFMDALGARRIPDPTTAGDFLRRFKENDVVRLMEITNGLNQRVWQAKVNKKKTDAILDVDDTIQMTYGEKKEGMAMSYKGIWGFAPLIITEANTGTHLYAVNRSGNKTSSSKVSHWIDESIKTVKGYFRNIYIRGDSEFCLTTDFDRWHDKGAFFTFSFDAIEKVVSKAFFLPGYKWRRLRREKKHADNGKTNVKSEFIKEKGYKNFERKKEYIAEFRYKPGACENEYRMIVIKRIVTVTEGQATLFEQPRLFFYITNIEHMTAEEVIAHINGRCNHENKIQQLKDKDGVHALKMPAAEFTANWAYMAIGLLAWNIKSWMGLFMNSNEKRKKVINMEMKTFQNYLINIPCQIITASRYVTHRFLNFTPWLDDLFRMASAMKGFKPT